ncbi:hypothetical protein [Plasticicumulans sp.]|uniref:hypothetical protein n=2 Tax=Plasticicumulans sp. TaxID=2307179 RepID=UPI002C4CB1D3|nr:hypothetical protein [Plasticicumulans sp.]HNM45305.1 hypothetical protein [Plasticicumulans sp.]
MSKHHDRNKMLNQILHAERLQQLLAPTEADLAEVEAMSEAELDEELAAAGIDYAAFAARLQQTLANHETPTLTPAPALPAGLAWLQRRGRRWLQATFEGLEDLRRGCAPMAPVLDAGLRETLPAALQAASLPVAVLSLHAVTGGVRLAVRWLAGAPDTAPAVDARLRGMRLPPAGWLDWHAPGQRTQALFIGCTLDAATLEQHDGPVLRYAWEAATGRLEIELLPDGDEDDGA